MGDKAISFAFIKKEKGWMCWYEPEHQAEGILTLKDGSEIPSCLVCAKSKAKFKKNRKGWYKRLQERELTISSKKSPIKNAVPLDLNDIGSNIQTLKGGLNNG